MRTSVFIIFLLTGSVCMGKNGKDNFSDKKDKIVIEIELPAALRSIENSIKYAPYDYAVKAPWKEFTPVAQGKVVYIVLPAEGPIVVDLRSVVGNAAINNLSFFFEPGDSLHIDLKGKKPVYSGRNIDKFIMFQQVWERKGQIPLPANKSFRDVLSPKDYLDWNQYLYELELSADSIFNSYSGRISTLAYNYLKAYEISDYEYKRLFKFELLERKMLAEKHPNAGNVLGSIFDSTMNNPYIKWLHAYPGKVGKPHYFYSFVRCSVERRYNFNIGHPDLGSVNRKILYTELAKKLYKNEILQGVLVNLLTENGLKEHIHSPVIDSLLADYYAQADYPAYKDYVRTYELGMREWFLRAGQPAPDFSLQDRNGYKVDKQSLNGKVVLLSFFKADCNACPEMDQALDKAMDLFPGDTNLVRVTVLCDQHNDKAAFPVSNRRHLYLQAGFQDLPVIAKQYAIKSYPKALLLNSRGELVFSGFREIGDGLNSFSDLGEDNGAALSGQIGKSLQELKDGPYVLYDNRKATVYSVWGKNIKENEYDAQREIEVNVGTDRYNETFSVSLKKNHRNEPSQFPSSEKLLALSDIEGNFDAFKKLLIAGGVIDTSYNWTFGNGRLVFSGDMFDRGYQVTECLWLIYSLEEKAKAAGGYVHFILGNHEIMNLQGMHKYATKKYRDNAGRIGKSLKELYGENSELGSWLRTKNVAEKIGDLLFMHGGVSAELNRTGLTIKQINELARPNYAESKSDYGNSRINTVMSTKAGPFWFRGYYGNDKIDETIVDSTLQQFRVNHIITGHTIVSDAITTHYQNKVINTDTKHAEGESEALLIEGGRYYRVNDKGERVLLFVDDKRKSTSSE